MSVDPIQLKPDALLSALGHEWEPEEIEAALELLAAGGRFPSGVRKLPPDLIKAVQRERLIVAMLSAVSELGFLGTNVQDVIDRAGVSRPTFYEHFSNKEDCFLAAFDTSAERLVKKVEAAVNKGGSVWRDRVRFGLEAILRLAAREPEVARAMVVEARAASTAAVQRRVELMDRFARCLDEQARELLPGPAQTAMTASGVVGGVESLLYSRLCKQEHDQLQSLLPSLMYFIVLPYEGHLAANEVFVVK